MLPRSHSSFARRPLRLASRCSKSLGVRCASGDVMLEVKGLEARVASTGEHILRGVNLTVREGEIHAIMGTNGSGKSTFSKVLVGHPDYEVTGGTGTLSACYVQPTFRLSIFLAASLDSHLPSTSILGLGPTSFDACCSINCWQVQQHTEGRTCLSLSLKTELALDCSCPFRVQ